MSGVIHTRHGSYKIAAESCFKVPGYPSMWPYWASFKIRDVAQVIDVILDFLKNKILI